MMVMTVRAMDMSMRDFLIRCIAHTFNRCLKAYLHTGQRMVAVYHRLAVGNIGYTVDNNFAGFRIVGFKHHADFDLHREHADIFDTHQIRLLLAERIIWRKHHIYRIADILAVQRLFHQRENTVITTMQIDNRFFSLIQKLIVDIIHFIMQRNYGIFHDSHIYPFRDSRLITSEF